MRIIQLTSVMEPHRMHPVFIVVDKIASFERSRTAFDGIKNYGTTITMTGTCEIPVKESTTEVIKAINEAMKGHGG